MLIFVILAERQSDTESQTNEDSSDTNTAAPTTNHIDSTLKNSGKHSTNSTSFASNGTQNQNGLDRSSPVRDVSAKQKNFSNSAKKNNSKKARHR